MRKDEAVKIAKDLRANCIGKRYKNENYKGFVFRLIEANSENIISDRWDVQVIFEIKKGMKELKEKQQKCYFKEYISDYFQLRGQLH
jgi:hypothetical protein